MRTAPTVGGAGYECGRVGVLIQVRVNRPDTWSMRSLSALPRCAALLGAAVILAGCGSGEQTGKDFDDWLADNPYEGMTMSKVMAREVLPGAGTADITVALDSDASTPESEMVGAMKHVCKFEPRGMNAADFSVQADRVTVMVDCADTDALGEQWQALRVLPGLVGAELGPASVHTWFSSHASAVAGLAVLRESGLPVTRLKVGVAKPNGDYGWSLQEDTDVSDRTRRAVDRVLEERGLVWMVTTFPADDTSPERVTVVADGSNVIARILREDIYGEHPEWKSWVNIVPDPKTT
jgi:hypothetical protein